MLGQVSGPRYFWVQLAFLVLDWWVFQWTEIVFPPFRSQYTNLDSKLLATKGQIMSECIYEIIDFPKYHLKNLIDFCPESLYMLCTHLSRVALRIIKTNHMYLVYKTFQGRNLSNFFGGILENRWFHKYILTLSDL